MMKAKALVKFAREKIGTPYVYGMKGTVMTQANFQYLRNAYGDRYVPYSDVKKIGKVCVDCSGLISWACGIMLGSSQWMEMANVKKPISTIKEAPIGALVWMPGHIGIYSGMKNGVHHYIAADGSKHGVREVPIGYNRFTHWLLVESVFSYDREEDEMVVKDKLIVNGKEYMVDMIRKDGITFIKTRDIADVLNMLVSSQGRIPTLTTK